MEVAIVLIFLILMISLRPESNATYLAQSVENVKLDSYEKLQKIKFK